MQNIGFISEYLLLNFYHQRQPTSQQRFDIEASFSSFDFGINFPLKGCFCQDFVIKLEPLLSKKVPLLATPTRKAESYVWGKTVGRIYRDVNVDSPPALGIFFQKSFSKIYFISGYGHRVAGVERMAR